MIESLLAPVLVPCSPQLPPEVPYSFTLLNFAVTIPLLFFSFTSNIVSFKHNISLCRSWGFLQTLCYVYFLTIGFRFCSVWCFWDGSILMHVALVTFPCYMVCCCVNTLSFIHSFIHEHLITSYIHMYIYRLHCIFIPLNQWFFISSRHIAFIGCNITNIFFPFWPVFSPSSFGVEELVFSGSWIINLFLTC